MSIKQLFILPIITFGAMVSCSNNDTGGYTDKDMVISVLPKSEIVVSEETVLYVANSELNKKVSWSSKSPEICSVNNDGIVKGLKEGQCELNATYKSLVSSFTINVIPNSSILDIVLSNENVFLSLEDSFVVSGYATYQDEEVLDEINFTWTSKNENVVKASPSIGGNEATLIPTGVGETDVLVSATYKGVSAISALSVVVQEHSVSFALVSRDNHLIISPTTEGFDVTLNAQNNDARFDCSAFVDGEEADELNIIWDSTAPNICAVKYNITNKYLYFDSGVTGNCTITGNYRNMGSFVLNVVVKESV